MCIDMQRSRPYIGTSRLIQPSPIIPSLFNFFNKTEVPNPFICVQQNINQLMLTDHSDIS